MRLVLITLLSMFTATGAQAQLLVDVDFGRDLSVSSHLWLGDDTSFDADDHDEIEGNADWTRAPVATLNHDSDEGIGIAEIHSTVSSGLASATIHASSFASGSAQAGETAENTGDTVDAVRASIDSGARL